MPLRLSDKAQRMLTFLLGLGDGSIAAALEAHGLSQAEIDEGWNLLRALGRRQLSHGTPPEVVSLKQQLDEWENYWYPIIDAVLARHYPAIHDAVFLNLQQVDVDQVAFTVSLLLERLDSLRAETGPFGADGPKAMELLDRRRVTESVLAKPRELLAALQKFAPDNKQMTEEEDARLTEEAERSAWGWYLEWGRIARTVIQNRRLLRKLGYLDARGDIVPDEEPAPAVEAPASSPVNTAAPSVAAGAARAGAALACAGAAPALDGSSQSKPGMPGSSPFEE